MPSYKPTQNAQDVKFSYSLYGGPDSFSLTIPADELSYYPLGGEVLIGDKFIAEATKRVKTDDYTYAIEGHGFKERLAGIAFKGKYNIYDEQDNLLPGARSINDIGDILDDLEDYISTVGLSFNGTSPYLVSGIAPYNCNLSGSVSDIITHIAQAAGKGWHINQSKNIIFCDIVKYSGQEFSEEVLNDVVNVLIIKGTLKAPYIASNSEVEKFKYFTTITDNTGFFCPQNYIGDPWESQDVRFESPSKVFIFADAASIALYGRKSADIDVPYIDSNAEATDFAAEYFSNNAAPIRSNTSFTIGSTEAYPNEKGAKRSFCKLLPTGQVRADYHYYSAVDSLYNTEFIMGVKDNNKEKLINELDTKPPKVSLLGRKPTAHENTYTAIKNPIYLACYARDDNGVSAVKFYRSKWNAGTGAWSAYTLIGNGAWQAPPDSDSEGYYQYNANNGYYDLIADGVLARGDIFRIKSTATDSAGNVGEDVQEYQLDVDAPKLAVSVITDETTPTNAPSTIEAAEGTTFKFKIMAEDLSVSGAPVVVYAGAAVAVTKPVGENYYETAAMSAPPQGEYWTVTVTVTNVFGQVTKSVHYVKGVKMPAMGVGVTVRDWDSNADDTTVSVLQFKDKIEFSASFKDYFYKVGAGDVSFKIYNQSDSNVKTITNISTPALAENPSNSGKFKCGTTVAVLGLSAGIYSVACSLVKNEKFIDEAGVEHNGASSATEGDRFPFEIVAKTQRGRLTDLDDRVTVVEPIIDDHETRLPIAEQQAVKAYTENFTDKKGEIKFYPAATSPDGNSGWFSTNDSLAGTPVWTRIGSAGGGNAEYIEATYNSVKYRLVVSSTDGSLQFISDVDGAPVTRLTVSPAGVITTNGDVLPDADATNDIGSATMQYANLYVSDVVYCNDINDVNANWSIEYNVTAGLAVPRNVAIGFMNG